MQTNAYVKLQKENTHIDYAKYQPSEANRNPSECHEKKRKERLAKQDYF